METAGKGFIHFVNAEIAFWTNEYGDVWSGRRRDGRDCAGKTLCGKRRADMAEKVVFRRGVVTMTNVFQSNKADIILNTYKGEERAKTIKSSELVAVIEARIEEIFTLVNNAITSEGVKGSINNVILTGQGITSIAKSDVVGKIILNIPVKMSTGRFISTIQPSYRSSYALVRYIASRPFTKNVSSNIDTKSKDNIFKTLMERIKEFFYS